MRSLALKKGNIHACPEDRCTRMFLQSRRLVEHGIRGVHSDGINSFRTMQSGSVMNHEFSLNDIAKKHATLLLTGSGCSAIQRLPHHLTSSSSETLQREVLLLNAVDTRHFVPGPGFGQQISEPSVRREFIVIRFLYLSFNYGNENKLFLVTADQTASDMPVFGTMLGEQKHPGHPLWKANESGVATFRVKHYLTTAIIKGYYSKPPSEFKKQYDRAESKHKSMHPVFPQLQPLAAMQQPNQFDELASSAEAGSDSSDSDLDENAGVEELILIAAMASEQRLDPGHAGGEDYEGELIEASTENRERLVGASLESLKLAEAPRAAESNTTAGIAAEFAADLNVPAGISGKPTSVTHSNVMYL